MSVISDIASRVCEDYLKRDDLLALAAKEAWTVYQLVCSKVPFDELSTTSAERPVSTTTAVHSLSDLQPELAGVVSIRMNYGSNRVRRLRRSHVRLFDALNPALTGQPALYARWGNSIEFDRVANISGYTYRVRYWSRPTPEADVGDTQILTPPEWDELYMWETLYRLYTLLDQHEKAMSLIQTAMMPRQASPKRTITFEAGIIPRLWNDLLVTVSQRENTDEEFSINPTTRPYTAARG